MSEGSSFAFQIDNFGGNVEDVLKSVGVVQILEDLYRHLDNRRRNCYDVINKTEDQVCAKSEEMRREVIAWSSYWEEWERKVTGTPPTSALPCSFHFNVHRWL